MKPNVGSIERIARVVLGVVLIAAAIWGGLGSTLAWVLGIFGALAIFAGVTGWCFMYVLLGINTCKAPKKEV
jgi:predicted anti-sigma-YlaC factor YlaD